MNDQDYIAQRLDDQLAWMEGKAAWNQSWYKRLRMLELVAAALLPLLAGLGDRVPDGPLWIGVLGVLVALCSGAMSLYKFHENWLQYRTTAEQLKQERFFYLTASGPYAEAASLQLLVQRVEALLAKENATWAQGVGSAGGARQEPPEANQAGDALTPSAAPRLD